MLRSLFPIDKYEVILFLIFFVIYGTLAVFIASQTSITDREPAINDAYFSFDNIYMSHHGITNLEGHPLIKIITFILIYTGIALNLIFATAKAKAIFLVLVCSFLISSSNIFIFRYLRKIIFLKGHTLYLITFFYATFSTNLFLSFTFESFTFSIYILTFILYYYSYSIKENKQISFLTNTILAITAGGITITNFSKGILPILFLAEKKRTILKRIITIGCIFASILLVLELSFNLFSVIQNRLSLFIVKDEAIYQYLIDMFLGAPILLPSLITYFPDGPHFQGINIDFYHYWWQYSVIGTIASISLLGIIKNYKNKLIYIPIAFFTVDLLLHVVIKYGINEGMIYGGHWIFIVPILAGWLYKSLKNKQKHILDLVLTLLFIIIFINNIFQLNNFIKIALQLFPVS